MSKVMKRYELKETHTTQAVNMPKRARIVFVAVGKNGPCLCAIVEEDADTRAFDRGVHQRHFVVVEDGRECPEVGGYTGSVQTAGNQKQSSCLHVFEVPR